MKTWCRKISRVVAVCSALLFFAFSAQAQLTNVVVDPGPYGGGSNISVSLNFANNQSEFKIGNVFTLYISDSNGNFIGNGTQIGTYSGFYTSFINGILPLNLQQGNGYKLRILASSPAQVIDIPGTIDIRNVQSKPITITPSLLSRDLGGDNLGWCPAEAKNGQSFFVKSDAINPSTVIIEVKNLKTGTTTTFNEIVGSGVDITGIDIGYYLITVISTTNTGGVNIKSIKSYFLHNTPLLVNIQDSGQNIGCINGPGQSARVSFQLTLIGGIDNNYPGTIYRVDWGDGSTSESTIYEITTNASKISHDYTRTSCGEPTIPGNPPISNSFKTTVNAISEVCNVSRPATAYAQVFINPIARITPVNSVGCINTLIRFTNASTGGTRQNCSPLMDYTWYVDGKKIIEFSDTRPFDHIFITTGKHIVTLVASNGVGVCLPSEFNTEICIQDPPKPAFEITTPTTGCAPFTVEVLDKSKIDQSCPAAPSPIYNWIVTNTNGTRFTAFTNNIPNPKFIFTNPGVYNIALEISTGACSPVKSQLPNPIVIINGQPTVSLADPTKLCRLGSYSFDNIPNTPTQTIFTGTQVDLPDTYTWTVTDENGNALTNDDYSFDAGFSMNSKYPSINFKKNRIYIITVIHKNTCATVTKSQKIEFVAAPSINLGADKNICFTQSTVNLEAIITGMVKNGKWVGGSGIFGNVNSTITTYTPTENEKITGLVTLTYTAETDLQEPCKTISEKIRIYIKKEIRITSSDKLTICSGNPLNYSPISNLDNTVYTWTAKGSSNANGFNDSASPGLSIADVLANSDPINPATVTYTITPVNDGCSGVPFTLTVTIAPRPIVTATPAFLNICSNQTASIALSSNLPDTKYTWTSTSVAGVTGFTNNSNPTSTSIINDNLVNNTSAPVIVTYTITPISINDCTGLPYTVNITVQPLPTIPNAGLDDNICSTGTYILKGNKAIVGIGRWTQVSNYPAVNISSDDQENATVSGLVAGNEYIFRWTITTAQGCFLIDDVKITINPFSVGGTIVGAKTVCAGNNSGSITLSEQVGSVVRWESSTDGWVNWNTIDNTTVSIAYSNLNTTTQYRAVVQSGACKPEFSTPATITVVPATTIADAGTNQVLCNETSAQLNALSTLKAGETGRWTVVSPILSNTQITDPTNPATTITKLTPGQTYIFTWTVIGPSPCGPTQDNVTITDLLPLTNTISSTSAEVCYNQSIAVTGDTPTGGNGTYTYQWQSSADGNTWADISGQTGKDLNVPVTTSAFYRRIVNSNVCTSNSNSVEIKVLPVVIGNTIASDQTICIGSPALTITGTTPTGGSGTYLYQWQSSINNGVTWVDVTGATGRDFTPSALSVTILYRRSVTSGTCSNFSTPVKITVNPSAKAEITYTTDFGCPPFVLTPAIIKANAYPDRNDTYTWFADNVQIGTGINFPGYTITGENKAVVIKLVVTSSLGCTGDETSHTFSTQQDVKAAFTQSVTQGCGPLAVNFTNTSNSLTASSFKWDFGNGTTSNLAQPGPVTFQADPTGKDITYTITLSAITPCGTTTQKSTVLVQGKAVSIFSPDKTTGCSPLLVNFSNTSPVSSGTTYTFDFNDGSPKVITNDRSSVNHLFTTLAVRDYVITMTAENACGKSTSSYTLRVSPNDITPELVVNAGELTGCAPLKVNFYNNSKGASKFIYDFGDGTGIQITNSAPETVSHIFTKPGKFTVTLYASNDCSNAQTTETITVLAQPTVEFTADKTAICDGGLVKFKNTSKNAIGYTWDFGDGTTSAEFEPEHIYKGAGKNYTVKLTSINLLGCTNTLVLTDYINIAPELKSIFTVLPGNELSIPNFTFSFKDASLNGAGSWEWNFGDGTSSTLQNPTHTYPNVGDYTVTLKILNKEGCSAVSSQAVRIIGVPGFLYVPNSFMPASQKNELQTFRAKGRGIDTWKMTVFNKWGQVLWETTKLDDGAPLEGWDGRYNGQEQPQGVYFWKIDVKFINGGEWKGMTYDSSPPKKTGNIYLIR
ncbi:PKD domain-containing protein [Pedobacter rhodius]|uniref:PKD domain-containing protein n=1 Tax=Pedobacter rhodius TaxID=3004098 RepID=A0ABT4KZ33_9SPHI|nr:PKD domain-containing protein [Pedobacter sp. SJ11]MCZ4224187.1 PKD domain-containing protein [Pedobacter sp. SJ11]